MDCHGHSGAAVLGTFVVVGGGIDLERDGARRELGGHFEHAAARDGEGLARRLPDNDEGIVAFGL